MTSKQVFIYFGLMGIIISCTKIETTNSRNPTNPSNPTNSVSCSNFKNLKIHPVNSYTCGDKIELFVDSFEGARYDWEGPGYSYHDYQNIWIPNVNINNRGYYKVTIYYDSCPPIYDSIYVDVKLPQGNPNCSPANNTSTYSSGISIPTKNFDYVTLYTFYSYKIEGSCSYGDLAISFNSFWINNKLESGIYYTTSEDKINDKESINKVFIEDRYANERWFGEMDKPVYVSYVNDKLTITFCDIPIKAVTSSGSIYNSNVSAQLTLP